MYKEYAKHIGANSFLLTWVDTTLKNYCVKNKPTTEEVEHILDYLVQSNKKLERMSYEQALKLTCAWDKTQQKKGNGIEEKPEDTEVVLDFKDGFKIVKLIGENAYKREGFLMRHCVASYYGKRVEVYSLRDKDNMPHCTMEKNQQVKGKGNGDIHPKYVGYVVKFLEHIGMTVGDSEMLHLGYVNVEKLLPDSDDISKHLFGGKYILKSQRNLITKDKKERNDIALLDVFPLIEEVEETLKVAFHIPTLVTASIGWIKTKITLVDKIKNLTSDTKIEAGGNDSMLAGGNDSMLAGGNDSMLAGGNDSMLAGGNDSMLAGGDNSKLAGGDNSKLAGGYSSKLAGGNDSMLAGGDYSMLAGGNDSMLAGGYSSMLAGGYSSKLAGGDYSMLAGGDYSKLAGGKGSIMVGDRNSQAQGKIGACIVLCERDENYNLVKVVAKIIDGKILKEDTYYKLEKGKLKEVK